MKLIYRSAIAMLAVTAAPTRNPSRSYGSLPEAIQAGDTAAVLSLLNRGADVNGRSEDGSTPLMVAALYSDPPMMRMLLDRGADPNAKNNAGATALVWGIGDAHKIRLLLGRGVDVNARTKSGRTALHVGSMIDGGHEVVRMLIDAGAVVDAKDENGATPLIEASGALDTRTPRLLLARKADVNVKDRADRTPLITAIVNGSLAGVKLFLKHGADPSVGGIFGLPAIVLAAIKNDTDVFRAIAGTNVNLKARDGFENTALIWAAASEKANTAIVGDLLKHGVDVNAKNKLGQTALDLAKLRGNTPVVAMLKQAGATEDARAATIQPVEWNKAGTPHAAVESALAVLKKGGEGFAKKARCAFCHNQSVPVMAATAARERGIAIDEKFIQEQSAFTKKAFAPGADKLLEGVEFIPDLPVTGSYTLLGLAADNHAPDKMTAATVQYLAFRQLSDGRWAARAPRPPIEYSDVTATALSLRALQIYGIEGRTQEFRPRIQKAREWLNKAKARSTEESAMQLMGLTWAKANPDVVNLKPKRLLGEQRPDGGWGSAPKPRKRCLCDGAGADGTANGWRDHRHERGLSAGPGFPAADAAQGRLVAGENAVIPVPAILRVRLPKRT